ncbi:hydroxypyruvate isomerase family protein [Nesterenkonia lutea]|uniref:Hydroxypyruvate isomerase n=1 Tax=Nesterenkonia lutea TaxID=272919 RepID=A0ABR9JDW0_9MICC|nr:TIM barrel protein [Nesterenkonia lutea]MBE1523677.1 hydroxypyruvate isomerase [Nesterenkonia lutea]
MDDEIRWVLNLSLLFNEHELLHRPGAAKAAGFDEVEFWWPFGTTGRPSRTEIESFVDSINNAGVHLTAMNLFAGDMPAGERGVLSYPERSDEFRDSVAIAMEVGERLGTQLFNAPYSHRRDGLGHAEQDRLADENLAFAARAATEIGGTVLLEPVSKMPRYPIKTSADAVGIIDRVQKATGVTNLGFLLDQYHVGMSGEDVIEVIEEHSARIKHVQLADIPGRGQPGSGEANIRGAVELLMSKGYEGAFALEYIPQGTTAESLTDWQREQKKWS